MPKTLLNLNTQVPTAESGGTPAIVTYDNGDWEIAFIGDVDYITEGVSNFFKAIPFIDFFVGLMIYFDIGDVDDLDVSGSTVMLFIEETIVTGSQDEPVLLLWDDGEFDVMDRCEAESIMSTDPDAALNFISAHDLFEDFSKWRSRVDEEIMFGNDINTIGDDEDEEDEE